jgi:hypothetical protein
VTVKADSWPGLVTNASPFAVPLGAAVEQTNLESRIPGQLTARSGMQRVATTGTSAALLDCYPYAVNGKTYLVAMTSAGALVALESPAYGPGTDTPTDPALSSSSGSTQTSYTYRYANPDAPALAAAVAPASTLVSTLDGGGVGTTAPAYIVDAAVGCASPAAVSEVDGGSASDDSPEPSLLLSELCPL